MHISLKTWIKIVVTVVLVAWLVKTVDWSSVLGIMAQASIPLILVYICFQMLGNIISAAKWRYLARLQGFSFSLTEGFFAYLSGAFINNFLPSTMGGDAYRVMWMSRTGERARAFAVVFFDRITGLLALVLLAGMGIAFLPWRTLLEQPAFIIFAAITLSVTLVMLLALIWTERFYAGMMFLVRLLPWEKPVALLRNFEPFISSRVYARAIAWAVCFTAIGIGGSNYFLFSSLGAHLSVGAFMSAIFAATLVANIPISINNIGVKEWAYVFFFGLVGVSTELAVTAALASRFLQMFISFIALPQYSSQRKREGHQAVAASSRYSV